MKPKLEQFKALDRYQQARALGYAAGLSGQNRPHKQMAVWLSDAGELDAFNLGLMNGKAAIKESK